MDAVHSPRNSRAATPLRPGRRFARIVAPAVALLAAATLAACSPAPRRIVAVFLDGEAPTIALHPCSGEPVNGIQVRDVTPRPAATGSAAVTANPSRTGSATPDPSLLRWDVGSSDTPAPTQLRLLSVPAGWSVYTDEDRLLQEFREDRTYDVSTTVIGDLGVEFTLADLARLEPGQVWATPSDTRTPRAMSRSEFDAVAADSCD
jgi:hypothetical protein